jgi:hypothetical protein
MRNTSRLFILFTAFGLLAITACNKTSTANNNPQSGSTGHLKTMIQTTSSGGQAYVITTGYTYDSQYRLITQISMTKVAGVIIGGDTTIYSYSTGTVTMSNSILGVITYTLNAQGFRTSDNLGDTWAYNAAGYQVSSTQQASGTSVTYKYNTQNQLDSQISVSASGTNIYTYTYFSTNSAAAGSSWQTGQSAGFFVSGEVENQSGTVTTVDFTATFYEQSSNTWRLTTEEAYYTPASSPPVSTSFIYY